MKKYVLDCYEMIDNLYTIYYLTYTKVSFNHLDFIKKIIKTIDSLEKIINFLPETDVKYIDLDILSQFILQITFVEHLKKIQNALKLYPILGTILLYPKKIAAAEKLYAALRSFLSRYGVDNHLYDDIELRKKDFSQDNFPYFLYEVKKIESF